MRKFDDKAVHLRPLRSIVDVGNGMVKLDPVDFFIGIDPPSNVVPVRNRAEPQVLIEIIEGCITVKGEHPVQMILGLENLSDG